MKLENSQPDQEGSAAHEDYSSTAYPSTDYPSTDNPANDGVSDVPEASSVEEDNDENDIQLSLFSFINTAYNNNNSLVKSTEDNNNEPRDQIKCQDAAPTEHKSLNKCQDAAPTEEKSLDKIPPGDDDYEHHTSSADKNEILTIDIQSLTAQLQSFSNDLYNFVQVSSKLDLTPQFSEEIQHFIDNQVDFVVDVLIFIDEYMKVETSQSEQEGFLTHEDYSSTDYPSTDYPSTDYPSIDNPPDDGVSDVPEAFSVEEDIQLSLFSFINRAYNNNSSLVNNDPRVLKKCQDAAPTQDMSRHRKLPPVDAEYDWDAFGKLLRGEEDKNQEIPSIDEAKECEILPPELDESHDHLDNAISEEYRLTQEDILYQRKQLVEFMTDLSDFIMR
ncbi:hypothetical protein OTU49_004530 [Cherax quadricarinatus]|uniref:Uncharacterized protein n=1 Tax=Cherax quadricarinatus TaxID=27406 RepID=A0AAW0WYZ1_CHEQU